jgi:hypothetical protein
VKTAAQIANAAKVRVMQNIVRRLRASGFDARHDTWREMELDKRLRQELETYDFGRPERRSHLNKVSFPDANRTEVDAALKAGNNLNQIYLLACGRASVPKSSVGGFAAGKKGLKIVRHEGT